MDFIHYYFAPLHDSWWKGNIYGNILASIVCGLAVLFATRVILRLLRKQHTEHMALQKQHHEELKSALNIQDRI